MSSALDSVVEIGSFGLIDDFSGAEAAGQASSAAATTQAQAAQAATEEQRRQFDITQANLQPRLEAGNLALAQQQALLGLGGADAQQAAFAAFSDSPGQRFMRERAERALLRNQSAIGGLGGGNVRTALQEQAIGLAAQDFGNQFNRLGTISGGGQTAATNLGQFGAQAAGNIGQNIQQAGAARASGILGGQQARAQADQNVFNLLGTGLGAAFSDRRLKRDIEKVGEDEIGGIYHFRYIDNDQVFRGRMADELQKTRPDDVFEHESGYLAVTKEFAPEAI